MYGCSQEVVAIAIGLCEQMTPREVVVLNLKFPSIASNISVGKKCPNMKSGPFSIRIKGISLAFISYVSIFRQSLRKIKIEIACLCPVRDWVTIVNCPIKIDGKTITSFLSEETVRVAVENTQSPTFCPCQHSALTLTREGVSHRGHFLLVLEFCTGGALWRWTWPERPIAVSSGHHPENIWMIFLFFFCPYLWVCRQPARGQGFL